MSPEFSRPIALDRIGREPHAVTVEASAAECAAVAARLGLPAVERLACSFTLRREAASAVAATGRLSARVVRECVVTLEEFPAEIIEEFALRFVPAGSESEDIDLDGPDEIPYRNGVLDLGEAAAEQLALGLDPFPRKPGAELTDQAPQGGSPFAALEKLRRH